METPQLMITNLLDQLEKSGYAKSEIIKKDYNYETTITKDKEKVKILIYFGQKGIKTILQGNKESDLYISIEKILFNKNISPNIETEDNFDYIGVDESGKGDFFGPLVICGFYSPVKNFEVLKKIGIQDSKNLSDSSIVSISKKIKEIKEIYFDIVFISPKKYNAIYSKFLNLNKLLAWGHATAIENILARTSVEKVVCDKFGDESLILNALKEKGKKIEIIQKTKAERFLNVAAASILARNELINWFQVSEKNLGMRVNKGSGREVNLRANEIYRKFGKEVLDSFCKTHFKNYTYLEINKK